MPADLSSIVLYTQGTFDVRNPDRKQIAAMVEAAQDIAASGFGTVILGQWHVHADGSLYYNDSPLDSVIQALEVIPTALREGGTVQKVLLTFGPFGSDFRGIQTHLDSFRQAVEGLQATTGIDGLDWDLEQNYDDFGGLLVELTQWARSLGMTVTAAPYTAGEFWANVLKRTNPGGGAGMAWWNLQLYGGASYPAWVQELQGLVPSPESFLVPGFSVSQGSTPQSVASELSQLQARHPALDGGFVWQYEDLAKQGYTARQFAQAIAQGLGGLPSVPRAEPLPTPRP